MAFKPKTTGNRPAAKQMDACTVREYEQDGETKSAWTRIGVAFMNPDGSGKLLLDALPVSGQILIRPKFEKKDDE